MDISLADGLSFTIFEQVDVTVPVIFITAFDQYAIKAFKHNGIDYILKPIDAGELRASLERYHKKNETPDFKGTLKNMLEQFWSTTRFRDRVLVQAGAKSKSLPISEVTYIYAYERGTFFVDFSGVHFLGSETLDKLDSELDPNVFFRVNRKLIVSIKSIKEAHKYSTRQLELKLVVDCRVDAIVPADKITAFKSWLGGVKQ
jgi:DNA-binding LytR/AlgR family response regulator